MAIQRILVGVDDSPGSQGALAWASDLASAVQAQLVLVHVYEPLAHMAELAPGVDLAQLRERSRDFVERVLCQPLAARGLLHKGLTIEGIPADVLLDVARTERVDLIVVGARRLGFFKALALGSTSRKLSQHSTLPVTIVPRIE